MPVYAEALLQRIRRAEVAARLAARWLRLEGDNLKIDERAKLLDTQNTAGDTIDRCLRQLGLDGAKADAATDWAARLAKLRSDPPPVPTSQTIPAAGGLP